MLGIGRTRRWSRRLLSTRQPAIGDKRHEAREGSIRGRGHCTAVCNRTRAVAMTAISWSATISWACCIDGTTSMDATIGPPFWHHCRHRRQRGVGGDHRNFPPTRSLPAEDGIVDYRVTGWTNVVIPSAGKEAVAALTTTPGPSAPARKTSRIRTGPGGAGGGRPRTSSSASS